MIKFMINSRFEDNFENNNYDANSDLGVNDTNSYLCVNSAGYYKTDEVKNINPMIVDRNSGRNDYLFCYISKGRMSVYSNDVEKTVEQGFFILPPNVPQHFNNFKTEDEFEIYWVHFTGYGVNEFLSQCNLEAEKMYNTDTLGELPIMIELIIRELCFKVTNFEVMTEAVIMYILSTASRSVNSLRKNVKDVIDIRMQKALEYIYLFYMKNISVKELSDHVKLSTSRFSTLFKRTFGLFPLQYIIAYRIKRACDCLRHTELSITEVAASVGFEDPLYFSRAFKKQTGFSPSQYRKKINTDYFFVDWNKDKSEE